MDDKIILLIVDDMDMAVKSLADILGLDGYQVRTATSGAEALDIFDEEKIDCVLTDIKMPNMNGVELLGKIKQRKVEVPVLMMTAYATDKLVDEGMKAGAYKTLYKPLKIDNLRKQVAAALNGEAA